MTRFILSTAALFLVGSIAPAQDDVERPENERLAIKAIEDVRGWVGFDYDRPGRPVKDVDFYEPTDEHLKLLEPFPGLRGLVIRGGSVSDAGFARVGKFAQLEFLSIEHLSITQTGLAHIASLGRLKQLAIDQSTVADAGLVHLAKLSRLVRLSLKRSSISDEGLVHLGPLTQLRDVDLSGTQTTEAGIAKLKDALPYALIDSGQDRNESETNPVYRFLLITGAATVLGALVILVLRRHPAIRSRPYIGKATIVAVAIGLVGVGLLVVEPVMRPIKKGDAGTFWVHVCRIDVGAKDPRRPMGGFYLPRDGWFIYYDQGFHGQDLYKVPAEEVIALFPKLVEKLRHAPPGLLRPDVEKGFQTWLESGADPTDAAGFLARIHQARLDRVRARDPKSYAYALSEDTYFDERWIRIGRFHWNVRFEFVFLSGLIVFAAWPWLRGAGRVRRAVHLGLVPVLFCVPYWLGYAPLTFTSAGPGGGVLYPWLLALFRGLPWSDLDTLVLRNLPRLLEPLSQTPGPMLSISGGGGVGPVGATLVGLVVVVVVIGGPPALNWLERKSKRTRPPQEPEKPAQDSANPHQPRAV